MALIKFIDHIFSKFPTRYKVDDSYKDGNGRGLLERLCRVIGEELDISTSPYIEDFPNIRDASVYSSLPSNTDTNSLLSILARDMGTPPDYLGTLQGYSRLVRHVTHLYKTKGTKVSWEYFFAIVGVKASVVSSTTLDSRYDISLFDVDKFDNTCQKCAIVTILLTEVPPSITSEDIDRYSQTLANWLAPVHTQIAIKEVSPVVQFSLPVNSFSNYLNDIYIDSNGVCFGTDLDNSVRAFKEEGSELINVDTGIAGELRICSDYSGQNYYVVNRDPSNTIKAFQYPDTETWSKPGVLTGEAIDIEINVAGTYLGIICTGDSRLWKISPYTGNTLGIYTSPSGNPTSLHIDRSNYMILGTSTGRVIKLDANLNTIWEITSIASPIVDIESSNQSIYALDSTGKLHKITDTGIVKQSTQIENLTTPVDMAIDQTGAIYIADQADNSVKLVNYLTLETLLNYTGWEGTQILKVFSNRFFGNDVWISGNGSLQRVAFLKDATKEGIGYWEIGSTFIIS